MNSPSKAQVRASPPRPPLLSQPAAVLCLVLVASEGLYLLMAGMDAVNGWRAVGTFLLLFALLFAGLLAAWAAAGREGARVLPVLAGGAVLFRLTLLPAGLPPGTELVPGLRDDLAGERVVYERFLLYDSDLWRYLWEGHVGAHGYDPFVHAPGSPALDLVGDAERGEATDHRAIWSDVRDHVNHPAVPTIYPPLAQYAFRLSHALAPGSVLAFKALMVAADLLAGLFVVLALRAAGRPAGQAVLYLWNPLVVKVFAGSGHVDAVLVLALAVLAWAAARGRRTLMAAALGLAVLAKLAPLVLVPLLARRVGAARLALAGAVVGAGYLPFLSSGPALFGGLSAFARGWEFNAGPFLLLRALLSPFVPDPDAAARLVAAALVGAAALWAAHGLPDEPAAFAGRAALVLGALVLLSPAVMPWYLTWLLPFAVVAGQLPWLALSGLVGLAFLVMVDGTEDPLVLALEYGLFAMVAARSLRARLRLALPAGGSRMRSIGLLCLALLAGPAPEAAAQGSGSTAGSFPTAFNLVRDLEGTLVSADEQEGVFTITEKKTGEKVTFKVDEKIKLRADSKSSLGNRRELKLSDFPAGEPVRVTFRTTDKVAVELKLKKSDQ